MTCMPESWSSVASYVGSHTLTTSFTFFLLRSWKTIKKSYSTIHVTSSDDICDWNSAHNMPYQQAAQAFLGNGLCMNSELTLLLDVNEVKSHWFEARLSVSHWWIHTQLAHAIILTLVGPLKAPRWHSMDSGILLPEWTDLMWPLWAGSWWGISYAWSWSPMDPAPVHSDAEPCPHWARASGSYSCQTFPT